MTTLTSKTAQRPIPAAQTAAMTQPATPNRQVALPPETIQKSKKRAPRKIPLHPGLSSMPAPAPMSKKKSGKAWVSSLRNAYSMSHWAALV